MVGLTAFVGRPCACACSQLVPNCSVSVGFTYVVLRGELSTAVILVAGWGSVKGRQGISHCVAVWES